MATSKTIASTAAFVLPRHPDRVVRSLAGSALSQATRKAAEEMTRNVAGEGVRAFSSGFRLSKLFR
jgi:hypothetical protein